MRLRVLIPAVENAISGAAFRPGDVLRSRKGLTVEIGNTDAEGRLILADALALADEEAPDLIVDFATLTGAARVALGPELPPFYTDDDALAADLARPAAAVNDPVWRMPLWQPYAGLLESKIADVNNISGGPFAGSITAALFLRRFATAAKAHVHFDIYAWTPTAEARPPGRRRGAGARALVHALLEERYGAGRTASSGRLRMTFDRRLTPARPDLADERLRGSVRGGALRGRRRCGASTRRPRRCAAIRLPTRRSTPRR